MPPMPPMACHFRRSTFLIAFLALLYVQLFVGCVTFRVIKVNEGKEIAPPALDIAPGKTTLGNVLMKYGAPERVVELEGNTVLIYERSFYRGGQLSFGIPFSDITGVSANLTTFGNLLQYDSLVVFVTADGAVTQVVYEKGSSHPFWSTLYSN